MPEISRFFGMIITINYRDHNPPHFHAEYQGYEAIYNIKTAKKIKGQFPPSLNKILEKWARQYRKELLKSWDKARNNEPPKRVPEAR